MQPEWPAQTSEPQLPEPVSVSAVCVVSEPSLELTWDPLVEPSLVADSEPSMMALLVAGISVSSEDVAGPVVLVDEVVPRSEESPGEPCGEVGAGSSPQLEPMAAQRIAAVRRAEVDPRRRGSQAPKRVTAPSYPAVPTPGDFGCGQRA